MKKCISIFLSVVMIFSVMSISSLADNGISVVIDEVSQKYDVMPIIENGRTLVPLRGIFEALKAEVKWDDATKTATAKTTDVEVKITNESKTAYINGVPNELDVPALIENGRFVVVAKKVVENVDVEMTETPTEDIVEPEVVETVETEIGDQIIEE